AEAHDRRVRRGVARLRAAGICHLAFGGRELCTSRVDLGLELAGLLALGRDQEQPDHAEHGERRYADQDQTVAPGHRVPPFDVEAEPDAGALLADAGLRDAEGEEKADAAGSGSNVTCTLNTGSLPGQLPL